MDKKIKEEDLWCTYSDLPSPLAYDNCTDYDGMGNQGRFPKPEEKPPQKKRKFLDIIKKISIFTL